MLVATIGRHEDSQPGLCSKFQASQGFIETLFQNKTKTNQKRKLEGKLPAAIRAFPFIGMTFLTIRKTNGAASCNPSKPLLMSRKPRTVSELGKELSRSQG